MALFGKKKKDKKVSFEEYTGIIKDDDAIYENLDKWYDDNEYDKIAEAVLGVPFERWSNQLWFRLISAYNNLKQFDKAEVELQKLKPRCESPADIAHWLYMNGYIRFTNNKTFSALHLFEDGHAADPDDTGELDLQQEIDDCWVQIKKDLKILHDISDNIVKDIKLNCSKEADSDKLKLTDEQFTLVLGFLPGIRKIPGQERGLGFNEYFKRFEGEEKEWAKDWLKKLFNISDNESFKAFLQKSIYCNMAHFGDDTLAVINKNPNFQISELNDQGKRLFQDTTLFVNAFAEYLPKAGTHAWDICEKIGYLRYAYAVDYIPQEHYIDCMMALTEEAKANFDSTEEYVTSLIFGCALYMFMLDDCSIDSGIKFLSQMAAYILHGDLPHILWRK
ncbi:MAG: DUF1266 domain-containing protein [Ruminococcaceae bacterium]|nr:DUF1266 domain-containing protein [Oscillospiraceae bacterium]